MTPASGSGSTPERSSRPSRRAPDVGTLVCFHAHPDDEVISTGGTIARASAEGHRVVLVVATNGEHGEVPDDLAPGETLADRRRAETDAAADCPRDPPGRVARLQRLGDDGVGAEPRSGELPSRRPAGSRGAARSGPARGVGRRADHLRLARELRASRPHRRVSGRTSWQRSWCRRCESWKRR